MYNVLHKKVTKFSRNAATYNAGSCPSIDHGTRHFWRRCIVVCRTSNYHQSLWRWSPTELQISCPLNLPCRVQENHCLQLLHQRLCSPRIQSPTIHNQSFWMLSTISQPLKPAVEPESNWIPNLQGRAIWVHLWVSPNVIAVFLLYQN